VIEPGLSNLDFSVFKNNHVRKISENFNVHLTILADGGSADWTGNE
jgi:hypothetical protein